MAERVIQSQGEVAAIRRQPIDPKLGNLLEAVGNELDVYFDVTSGGQPAKSEGGKRTGSTRHDHGNAADLKAFVIEDGKRRYLDFSKPADQQMWSEIVRLSVAGGATGIGAGSSYMGNQTVHIGFGKPAVWGTTKKGGPPPPQWLSASFQDGFKTPPLNIPDVASAKAVAPMPADMSPRISLARGNPTGFAIAPPMPAPRLNRPALPSIPNRFDSPRTAQQVADLYAGILPAPSAPATTIAGRPDAPISDNTFNTRTGPAPVPSPFRDSVLARINATRAELAAPPRAPLPSMVTGRPDAPIPSNRLPARTTVAGRPDAPISDNTFNATPRPPLPMPRSAANDARARAGLWTGGDPGMGGLLGIPMASSIPPQGAAPPAREQSPLRPLAPVPAQMSAEVAQQRSSGSSAPPIPATMSAGLRPPVTQPRERVNVASNEPYVPQFIAQQVRVPNPAYVAPSGMTFTPTGGMVTVDQRNAIAGVPANSYQQPIRPQVPQYLTKTVMVPNPAYRAPVPAPLPSFRRAPVPATMSPALGLQRGDQIRRSAEQEMSAGVTGINMDFAPADVQNSTRWQTGY